MRGKPFFIEIVDSSLSWFYLTQIVQSQKREKESQPIVKRIQTSHAAKLRAGEYMTYKEKVIWPVFYMNFFSERIYNRTIYKKNMKDEKLLHDKLVSELKEKEQQKVKKSSDKIR